jgi:hypothetical protein
MSTPRAGDSFLGSKSSLPSHTQVHSQAHSTKLRGGASHKQVDSSIIPMKIDVSPKMLQTKTATEPPRSDDDELFENMSPLSHPSHTDNSTTSQSQDTRTIPSLEFTLSDTDTDPADLGHSLPRGSLMTSEQDDVNGIGEPSSLQKLHIHRFRSNTTSSDSSVVNLDALGSVEQREMERIRRKMQQAQSASSSSSLSLSLSGMAILNEPDHINTSNDMNTHDRSPVTEESAYVMGDTLINARDPKNRSSSFGSTDTSTYTSMTSHFPPPLPVASKARRASEGEGGSEGGSGGDETALRQTEGGGGSTNYSVDDSELFSDGLAGRLDSVYEVMPNNPS